MKSSNVVSMSSSTDSTNAAHSIAREYPGREGSAVHAYLHREEGVQWNAEYWYRRAGRSPVTGSLEDEWLTLAGELLG